MFPNSILTLAEELISACKYKGMRIGTAESCTGGLVAGSLTTVPGSSTVFERGFNTYSDQSKNELLGVSLEDIYAFGAVSAEIAAQMAEGVLNNSPVNITVAVTGIAGPDGGSPEKPVGTVHIASAYTNGKIRHQQCLFLGDRQKIRLDTVEAALNLMLHQVE